MNKEIEPIEEAWTLKDHLKRNKAAYITGGVSFAVITYLIMRGRHAVVGNAASDGPDMATVRSLSKHIGRGIPVTASRGIPVTGENASINNFVSGKNNVLSAISYISANRQGPPSWVVRCIETGNIFTSQNAASIEMDIPANELSRHLTGVLEDVRGFHFERVCMAA